MGLRGTVVAIVAGGLSGCILFTGSTDGFKRSSADAAPDSSLGCLWAGDCANDAGAQVCCLTLASTTVTSACASSCSQGEAVQLCRSSGECGGGPLHAPSLPLRHNQSPDSGVRSRSFVHGSVGTAREPSKSRFHSEPAGKRSAKTNPSRSTTSPVRTATGARKIGPSKAKV